MNEEQFYRCIPIVGWYNLHNSELVRRTVEKLVGGMRRILDFIGHKQEDIV